MIISFNSKIIEGSVRPQLLLLLKDNSNITKIKDALSKLKIKKSGLLALQGIESATQLKLDNNSNYLDILENVNKEVLNKLNIPSELLSLQKNQKTYNNLSESKTQLLTLTIIPLWKKLIKPILDIIISRNISEGFEAKVDKMAIPELYERKLNTGKLINDLTFLSDGEKKELFKSI